MPEPVLPPDQEIVKCQAGEADLFTALVANPEDEAAQQAWAAASEKLNRSVEAVHGLPAAVEQGTRQLAILEPLLAAAPGNSWWHLGAGLTQRHLGKLHERSGDMEHAESCWRQALERFRRLALTYTGSRSGRAGTSAISAKLARLLIGRNRAPDAAALLVSLMEELKPLDQDTVSEWRAALADTAMKVMAALPADAALRLAEATRAFLTAPGENHMTSTEMANQSALERAVTKLKK